MASRRIESSIGRWELVKSYNIPSVVNKPKLIGLISDDEICMTDLANYATYITNISTEQIQKLILTETDGKVSITSCAPIDSNLIVCGMEGRECTGATLKKCITLFDRQWKVVRHITIPNISNDTDVYVDVDRDGMILAAQYNQSNIYVINPSRGKTVKTITMKGKVAMGEIQALSSGDIVVKTTLEEFTVISRSGKEKAVIQRDDFSYCGVDKLTDTLYITSVEKSIGTVDQVSCDGIIQARRVVEYEKSGPYGPSIGQSFVTPFGTLVGFYGVKLFVHKKTIIA